MRMQGVLRNIQGEIDAAMVAKVGASAGGMAMARGGVWFANLAAQAGGAMSRGISSIPGLPFLGAYMGFRGAQAAFSGTIGTGVGFADRMENVQIGLAGMMRQMKPEQFQTFNSAMAGAEEVMHGIKREALTTVATFAELAEATQGLMSPMLNAGIKLGDTAKVAAMITRAVSAVMPWANSGQFIQEGRALLTGNINRNAFLAMSLGITPEEVHKAQKAGTVLQMIEQRLGAFTTAAQLTANTLTGLASNIRDAWEIAWGEGTQGLKEDLKKRLREVFDVLQSDEFKATAKGVGMIGQRVSAAAGAGIGWWRRLARAGGALGEAAVGGGGFWENWTRMSQEAADADAAKAAARANLTEPKGIPQWVKDVANAQDEVRKLAVKNLPLGEQLKLAKTEASDLEKRIANTADMSEKSKLWVQFAERQDDVLRLRREARKGSGVEFGAQLSESNQAGMFGSRGDWIAWTQSFNLQQQTVDELKTINDTLTKPLSIEIKGL